MCGNLTQEIERGLPRCSSEPPRQLPTMHDLAEAFARSPDPHAPYVPGSLPQSGFNYGTGNTDIRPAEYFEAVTVADQLRLAANAASRRAWELEMAIRAFRLAETAADKRHTFNNMVNLSQLRRKELPPSAFNDAG